MSTNPRDLLELRRDAPTSEELRKLATSIIGVGVADQLKGCWHDPLEQWHSRPTEVHVLVRCDECGEVKEDVRKRVNYWPNITAVCCAKCFTEITGECSGFSAC